MAFAAAHRGLSQEYAENTPAAFRAAIGLGFPCLEMDLRLTHDREVVILHDAGIERTTDGNGRVKDFTYAELAEYETGEGPVPRLDDVLGAFPEWDGLWNLEVKARSAVEPVLELVERHGMEGRALVSSMDPKALENARARHPDVPRGLIILGPPDEEDMEAAEAAGCTWLNVDHAFADDASIHRMRERGFRIGVWTVNDVERAVHLVGFGVDCIITDTRDVLAALPTPGRIAW